MFGLNIRKKYRLYEPANKQHTLYIYTHTQHTQTNKQTNKHTHQITAQQRNENRNTIFVVCYSLNKHIVVKNQDGKKHHDCQCKRLKWAGDVATHNGAIYITRGPSPRDQSEITIQPPWISDAMGRLPIIKIQSQVHTGARQYLLQITSNIYLQPSNH